jgi:hypothetical protein
MKTMTRKRILVALAVILTCSFINNAQTLDDSQQKRLMELNSSILHFDQKIAELTKQKQAVEVERLEILQKIAREQPEQSFKNSPPYVVVGVPSHSTVTLLLDGLKREVGLAGIHVKMASTDDALAFLKKKLEMGLVYIRCANAGCGEAYFYSNKEEPSLNAQLVNLSMAMPLDPATFDMTTGDSEKAARSEVSTPNQPAGAASVSESSRPTPGTDVHVKGYYRKDGTYVQPHTRSAPRRKP